jgi:hypothetical protein
MDSFDIYLDISLNNISPDLLNSSVKNKFLNLSSYLPDTFSHFLFGYEKILTDELNTMDISISAGNKNENYNFYQVFDFPAVSEYCLKNIHWQRLRETGRLWNCRDSLLCNNLEVIALEFDSSSLENDIPVPSVFFGIEKIPGRDYHGSDMGCPERMNVFLDSLDTVSGGISVSHKKALSDIQAKAADRFYISQAGLMLSRTNSPLKICLKIFTPADLLNFIPLIIENNYLIEEVNKVITRYSAYFDYYVLVPDISGSTISRLSIECYYKNKKQPSGEKRWEQVITMLTNEGLCSSKNAKSILNFTKKIMLDRLDDNYPEYYAQGLHHLKFSFKEDSEVSAKIYLWGGFHWKEK